MGTFAVNCRGKFGKFFEKRMKGSSYCHFPKKKSVFFFIHYGLDVYALVSY